MSTTVFIVELPADPQGNTGKPRAVVEGRIEAGPSGPQFRPVAPAEHAARWPSWYLDGAGGWARTAGPARMLTEGEWETIVAGLRPEWGRGR